MTAAAGIMAGSRILAAQIAGVAPVSAYKGSDQTVTSNATTYVNDGALFLPVQANATYLLIGTVIYQGATAPGDINMTWAIPAGATINNVAVGKNVSGVGVFPSLPYIFAAAGAGVSAAAMIIGTIITASTPGNVQMQWRQGTNSATPTIVKAGSVFGAWQIQ